MAQFTNLNLNGKPQSTAGTHATSGSKQKTALLVAAMVAVASGSFLLVANGCSKETEKSAIVAPSSQTSQPAQISPTPTAPSTPAASQPAKPKKSPKKRPATVAYKDPTYGISFRYPRKFTLKTGDDATLELNGVGPVPMNFVHPGGVPVAAVKLPDGAYPGTDLTAAFFNVSVNRSLTATECAQFTLTQAGDTEDGPVPASKVTVGGVEFDEMEAVAEEGRKQADAKYYHLFENGACYEFTMGLGTEDGTEAGADAGTEDHTAPVNRDEVFHRLEKILATVKIQSEVTPEVAAGTATPAAEGSNQ